MNAHNAPAVALPLLEAGPSRGVQGSCRGGWGLPLCRSVACGCLWAASATSMLCCPYVLLAVAASGVTCRIMQCALQLLVLLQSYCHGMGLSWCGLGYTISTKYSIAVAPHNQRGREFWVYAVRRGRYPYGVQHNLTPARCVAGCVGTTGRRR
jgi:hypothetical protein